MQRLVSRLHGSKEKYVTEASPIETLDTFIAELRVLSLSCDFGETVEDNILGQVIGKCYNGYLREKRLQHGDILTPEKPQRLGRAI